MSCMQWLKQPWSSIQSAFYSCDISLATVSSGFPDHVPAPRGNNLPHHLFLREQHGTSGDSGHVSPRRSRRADRGEDVQNN